MKLGISFLLLSSLFCLNGCRDNISESIQQVRVALKAEQVFFRPIGSDRILLTPSETVTIKRIAGGFLEKTPKIIKHIMGYQYGEFQFGDTVLLWQGNMLYRKIMSTDNFVVVEDMALVHLSNIYFTHLGKPPYRILNTKEWELVLMEGLK